MILFELTMPNCGSWNRKWSGEGGLYVKSRRNNQVPKEVIGKDYFYRWDDGWTAKVSVRKMDCREEQKIMKKSLGFLGYDWMIDSIIKYGEILTESERKEMK